MYFNCQRKEKNEHIKILIIFSGIGEHLVEPNGLLLQTYNVEQRIHNWSRGL